MTAVPLGETPSLCVLCPPDRARVARSGGMTDWVCHDRIDSALGEIVQRYARLSAKPSMQHQFVRRAPGYHSRPPVVMQAAVLRDPRTAPTTVGEPHSPVNLFIVWSRVMREERRQPPATYPPDATDLAVLDAEWRYLSASLDWITRQPWVVTFDEQVRACRDQLRAANNEPNPRPVGSCTKILADGQPCEHALFPPREGSFDIVCGACGAPYAPLDQVRMVHRSQVGCGRCGHLSLQHSNDIEGRPCNFDWCDCPGFLEDTP